MVSQVADRCPRPEQVRVTPLGARRAQCVVGQGSVPLMQFRLSSSEDRPRSSNTHDTAQHESLYFTVKESLLDEAAALHDLVSLSRGPARNQVPCSPRMYSNDTTRPRSPSRDEDDDEAMPVHVLFPAQVIALSDNSVMSDDSKSIETATTETLVDSDYESGVESSDTTSMSSSVHEFTYENGRRFHSFREGRYVFPNDEPEQEREDMRHAMTKMLCQQKLHFAPVGHGMQRVLDIGTGTGIWAIEMGDEYPGADIMGIDLSPIQPEWLPPNVHFVVDDVESRWLSPFNHFDYIHSRHTSMAIRDWRKLLRQSFQHLKPGGWFELQDMHHFPMRENGRPVSLNNPIVHYWANVCAGLANLAVNFNIMASGELPGMMRDAGFTNVTEHIIRIPLGTWPEDNEMKTIGLYWGTILLDGLQAIALGPLTRGLHWSPEAVELFLVQVRRAYIEDTTGMYMPFHIICGQKPG